MEASNKLLMDQLNALMGAQTAPLPRRNEVNPDEQAYSSASDRQKGNNAEGVAESDHINISDDKENLNVQAPIPGARTTLPTAGPAQGALPNTGRTGPHQSQYGRLPMHAPTGNDDISPAGPSGNGENIAEIVKQIMRENLVRKDEEDDWGFAPSKTPFTDNIIYAQCPKKWTPPSIPLYNGTSDPNLFLYKYDWHMTGSNASDEIKCRQFPMYLEGVASVWFSKLPVRSISRFTELAKKFKDQFRLYVTKSKDLMSLTGLDQRPGEPTKDFLKRFNASIAEVDNPDPRLIQMLLTHSLDKMTKLGKFVRKKDNLTLEKIYQRAEEYTRLEEDPDYNNIGIGSNVSMKAPPNDNNVHKSQKRGHEDQDQGKNSNKRSRFYSSKELTPLSDTPENIFFATQNNGYFPTPKRTKVDERAANSGRFCRFHNQSGHDTNDCRHLRNLIEELIRDGKLPQFMKKSQDAVPTPTTQGQQGASAPDNRAKTQNFIRPVIN